MHWLQFQKRNAEVSSGELPLFKSTSKAPADEGPSTSTFLNVGSNVLLDSQATGPWLIVNETGGYLVIDIVLLDSPTTKPLSDCE